MSDRELGSPTALVMAAFVTFTTLVGLGFFVAFEEGVLLLDPAKVVEVDILLV